MSHRVRVLAHQLAPFPTADKNTGDAPAMPTDPNMDRVQPMLINGEMVMASNGKTFVVINPATGHPFTRVPDGTMEDMDRAVASAKKAFKTWSRMPFSERAKCLMAFADNVSKRFDEFTRSVTFEMGKPLSFAGGETRSVIGTCRRLAKPEFGELKDELKKETKTTKHILQYAPKGVVGGITPWNFPLATVGGKFIPALITGNTVVLKPSPYTPYTSLLIGDAAKDAFPPGVLNVVSGSNDIGQHLVEHKDVAHITFTGSSATGKKIMSTASGTMKKITLELGGNDPAIVLPDAIPSKVTPKILDAAMFNTGQICVAAKRIFVHESQYEEYVNRFAEETKRLKMGSGFEKETTHAPINNKMQIDRVEMLVNEAKAQGARVVTGGKRFQPTDQPDGYYYEPTILADVKEGMRVVDEEQFGPVVPILKYSTVDEAIERANDTEYGLGGSVWTEDPDGKGAEVASQIQSGMVWINSHIGPGDPTMPVGGFKGSGVGREGGDDIGLKEFVEMRAVALNKKPAE